MRNNAASPRTFIEESPFMKIRREVDQAPELRYKLISKLESHFDAKVVTYFTSFTKAEGQISDDDAEMLESILNIEQDSRRIVLFVNSRGGNPLAAERIVNVCRSYSSTGQFEAVVPHMAKSAATMICFGASRIHMSPTAELGPVDPQIDYKDDAGQEHWTSADEYVRSYENLVKAAAEGDAERIEPFMQQLGRFDARYVESIRSAQRLSRDLSARLLKSSMMRRYGERTITKRIEIFLSQKLTSDHGRRIGADEARACGLNIAPIELRSDVWNIIWELYCRSDWVVCHSSAKMIESASSSVFA